MRQMKEQSVGKMEDTKKAFLLLLVLLTGICIYEPNPPRQAGKQIVAEACEGSYEDS